MERLNQRLKVARKALSTLTKVVGLKKPADERRDAAIQRFEYTFEAVWKFIQLYLSQKEGLSIASPKGCIRACRELGLLSATETVLALKMADARNLTVHTYNEAVARSIYRSLDDYSKLLKKWMDAAQSGLNN